MDNMHKVKITVRDRVFFAWQRSMESVRLFEGFIKEMEDGSDAKTLFEHISEREAVNSAELLSLLRKYEI